MKQNNIKEEIERILNKYKVWELGEDYTNRFGVGGIYTEQDSPMVQELTALIDKVRYETWLETINDVCEDLLQLKD